MYCVFTLALGKSVSFVELRRNALRLYVKLSREKFYISLRAYWLINSYLVKTIRVYQGGHIFLLRFRPKNTCAEFVEVRSSFFCFLFIEQIKNNSFSISISIET